MEGTDISLGLSDELGKVLERMVGEGLIQLEQLQDMFPTRTARTIAEKVAFAVQENYPFAMVYGPAGVGKTLAMKHLERKLGGIYIRCYPGYTAPALVRAIAAAAGITQVQQFNVLIGIVRDSLAVTPRLVILDDIETVPRDTLGTAKYLADETGSTFVLCTMTEYVGQIRRYRDIESRIGIVAQAMPLELSELVAIYAESGLNKPALKAIFSVTGGIMRDVRRLVRFLEEGIRRHNEGNPDQPMSLNDVDSKRIEQAAHLLNFSGGVR